MLAYASKDVFGPEAYFQKVRGKDPDFVRVNFGDNSFRQRSTYNTNLVFYSVFLRDQFSILVCMNFD